MEINDMYRIKVAVLDTGFEPVGKAFKDTVYEDVFGDGDNFGHGTKVISTIASNLSLTQQMVKIYNLRIFDKDKTTGDKVLKALDWCEKNRMDVINMSLGMEFVSKEISDRLFKLSEKSILVVASGNEYEKYPDVMLFPANLPCTIAVGSCDKNYNISSFSQRGFGLDLLSLGENVKTINHNGLTEYVNGTSFACPRVTSLIANILFQHVSHMMPFERSKENILNYMLQSNLIVQKNNYVICK